MYTACVSIADDDNADVHSHALCYSECSVIYDVIDDANPVLLCKESRQGLMTDVALLTYILTQAFP